jgi:hypothetical protein
MKIIRNLIAIIFLPAIFVSAWTLGSIFLRFAASSDSRYTSFWIGILCYALFQAVMYKPMRAYVFGHELTHAIAGILSGAKIKKFKVRKNSGSVVLNKDNIWITLSPYFIPLYAFLVIFIYLLIGYFAPLENFYSLFLFFLGFAISFHIALTIYIVKIGQSDLKVYGNFFSFIFIIAVNVAVFNILLAAAFPNEIELGFLISQTFQNIVFAYERLGYFLNF